jgi:hypothetical protein
MVYKIQEIKYSPREPLPIDMETFNGNAFVMKKWLN